MLEKPEGKHLQSLITKFHSELSAGLPCLHVTLYLYVCFLASATYVPPPTELRLSSASSWERAIAVSSDHRKRKGKAMTSGSPISSYVVTWCERFDFWSWDLSNFQCVQGFCQRQHNWAFARWFCCTGFNLLGEARARSVSQWQTARSKGPAKRLSCTRSAASSFKTVSLCLWQQPTPWRLW